MSIEAALAELTAAVKANTEAHEKLAQVAMTAQQNKAANNSTAEKSDAKDEPEAKEAEKPAEEKKSTKRTSTKRTSTKKSTAKKAEEPKLSASVDREELTNQARAFMSSDDEEKRDEAKEKFKSALDHLGAKKMSDVEEDDIPRLAGYISYWQAGLDVDFEAIDEKIAELADADEGGENGDSDEDMLG